jgi:hypothetical protein
MRQVETIRPVLSDDNWPRPRSATPSRSGARQGGYALGPRQQFGSKKVRRLLDNNDLVGSMGRVAAACDCEDVGYRQVA